MISSYTIIAIGSGVVLTSDQTIALRLFESLLILVPIWLAVTQYIIRTLLRDTSDSDTQGPKIAVPVAFIYSSYMILLLSLAGIRSILAPAIDSANLLVVIDLIVLFVVIVSLTLFSIIASEAGDLLEMVDISNLIDNSKLFRYIDQSSDESSTWFAIAMFIGLFIIFYWLFIGGLVLEILSWFLESLYKRW